MTITDSNQTAISGTVVPVLLRDVKVTVGFRASLFAAAARDGVGVEEFAVRAAAEKLKAAGAPFDGVFRPGDLTSEAGPNPFVGSDRRVALEIGGGFVTEAEDAEFQRIKPAGKTYFEFAISLMRDAVLARSAR